MHTKIAGLPTAPKATLLTLLSDFRRYLELRPDAPDRKAIEEMIPKLEAQKSSAP